MKINLDNLINLNYLIKHKQGHPPDLCLVNTAGTHKITLIPKNASTWLKKNLVGHGWQQCSNDSTHMSTLVVLRDPIDRWFSGVVQYLARNFPAVQHNTIGLDFIKLIFDQIELDEHTQSQFVFLNNIDLDSTSFVWIDHNFNNNIQTWLKATNSQLVNVNAIYTTAEDHYRQLLRNKLVDIYQSSPHLQQRLQSHFEIEYKMIETYGLKK